MIRFLDRGSMTAEVRSEVSAGWEEILDSGCFVGGAAVERFEAAWAEYCSTGFALGVANGTDALHLTLRALGIGPGDEVVLPANTFVATVEAVVLSGAVPRFADVDPDTLLMTGQTLENATTPATRAVIVVHLYGQMADMDDISRTAAELGIEIVEDAAQAQGATWHGTVAGSVGRAGCFSFYPGKNLGAFGDAGAVVTSDEELAERIAVLRDHGRVRGTHYEHDTVGTNSRLDALQAVVLSAKLPRLDGWNAARRALVDVYRRNLDPGFIQMVREAGPAAGVHHLAVVRVRDRARVRAELDRLGIATAIHYPTPCHRMAPYARYATAPLPIAEAAASQVLSLPLSPHMTQEQVEMVCRAVNRAAEGRAA